LPVILTIRSAAEGGAWTGDEAERVALLEHLGLLLPGFVDVECAVWQRSANVRQKIGLVADVPGYAADRVRNQLIVSHHDNRATPVDLAPVFQALVATPGHVHKAVFTARDSRDALRVLIELRRRASQHPTIALAMGEAGLVTRVLARKFGAFLTFATLRANGESAPGQPTIATLRKLYRWDDLRPTTRVYGVLGWPVAHSRGPHIHNAALRATDLDAVYVPLPVRPTWVGFTAFVDTVQRNPDLDFWGFSVTLPHKEHALRWLDEHGGPVAPVARRCGAVNTLMREADGTWSGHNTDVAGVVAALGALPAWTGDDWRGRRVAVLGAGGVARAVVAALMDRGCHVTVFNRTAERARRLATEFDCASAEWAVRTGHSADLLVNCTSLGMSPRVQETAYPDEALSPGLTVFDTVYQPAETRLLCAARARGCPTVSGVDMFLHQAAAQFKLWHGQPVALDALRKALPAE
jgi:3-dehydroquinate dehydratase/shikimate dehydrogenase